MTKYHTLITTPVEEIVNRFHQHGSVIGVQRSFGFMRGDNRARLFLVEFMNTHGLQEIAKQHRRKRSTYTIEDVRSAVINSGNIAQVLAKLGMQDHGGNHNTIKRIILEYGIDTGHFTSHKKSGNRYTHETLFCENSTYSRSSLSRVVRERKLVEYKCTVGECGNEGVWLGKPLKLVIDHINGISNDNRLENLRFICHNCHSQTPTFAGRNVRIRSVGEPG